VTVRRQAVTSGPAGMACGAHTAMRSLSGALLYRHHREGAAPRRLVGAECGNGRGGRGGGDRRRRHAPAGRPLRRPRQDPGHGRGRRGTRARAGDVAGLRVHPDREAEPAQVGRSPPPQGEISAARPGSRSGRRSAARRRPSRSRWPSRTGRPPRTRWQRTLGRRAGAEPDDRVLTGRLARHAPGRPRAGIRGTSQAPGVPRRGSRAAAGPGRPRCPGPGSSRRAQRGPAGGPRGASTAARIPAGSVPGSGACSRDGPGLGASATSRVIPRPAAAGRSLPAGLPASGS
jgi:hypothetical protein